MAAGRVPPNPSELLGSKAMRNLVEDLGKEALVILDAPPLLPVTDAALLTANADGALVVISAGRTVDAELNTALNHLAAVRGRALGVIMNRVPRRGAGSYGGALGRGLRNGVGALAGPAALAAAGVTTATIASAVKSQIDLSGRSAMVQNTTGLNYYFTKISKSVS